MGLYRTKQDLVNEVARHLGGLTQYISSEYQTPESDSIEKEIDLTIAREMELYQYPFSIVRLRLENETIDPLTTEDENGPRAKIYTIPEDLAQVYGVYITSDLPTVSSIILNQNYKSLSRDYNQDGANRLYLTETGEESEVLYLVYSTLNPDVASMSSSFQAYVTLRVASVFGSEISSGARKLARMNFEAMTARRQARQVAITQTILSIPPLVGIEEIARYGQPDGEL